jgi:type IV pilus assembly protein PilC
MKYEEFAFFNQQLAAMVRDGLPLEGALQRLCQEMRRGALRDELTKLGEDLAGGLPLREAVLKRQLPELYCQMLEVGAEAGDLPGVLTLLADHYQRRQVVWARLKGLMVYPMLVLFGALLLSFFLSFTLSALLRPALEPVFFGGPPAIARELFAVWCPPVLLALVTLACFIVVSVPRVRRAWRWRLPAFKEASVAQVASALALMLKSGVALDKALALVEKLERGTPAEIELARWRQRLSGGRGKFPEMAAGGRVFPPLFVWLAGQSGDDLPAGFERAAEVYQARAAYRIDTLLYSALPCAVMALGLVIVSQIYPVLAAFVSFMNAIGSQT